MFYTLSEEKKLRFLFLIAVQPSFLSKPVINAAKCKVAQNLVFNWLICLLNTLIYIVGNSGSLYQNDYLPVDVKMNYV